MKPDLSPSISFDRPKLFLFKFLAHQIHPFAYAVNTFLQPALDDCRRLLATNPHETFQLLLSLSQTFTRFAPDSDLIYDDIQEFACQLKDALDQCLPWLDDETLRQTSPLLESARKTLVSIIQQTKSDRTAYTEMYKNLSVLTNLEKVNSLPREMQNVLFNDELDRTIPVQVVNPPEIISIKETATPMAMTTIHHQTFPTGTSITNKLMNQMKNLTVGPSNSSINEQQTMKKSSGMIAAFPPRSALLNDYECETPTPIETGIRFGTTPAPYATSISSSIEDLDDFEDRKGREYYLHPKFSDPIAASADWHPTRDHLSIVVEQSHLNQTTINPHITDEFIQEFGNKSTRPVLRGDLVMTFGTPQSGPQSTCLPIGIGLSYDELTLLSCDVHRNSQNVRLFDIQTGRLKHTISSNQQMKFHRPSAVMSNARNNILIVERDFIYMTEPDGRLIQTFGHRSVKQLYGVATFRDRYLLTIDSKATDHQIPENTRLLLFDPNSGKLVFEQPLQINGESEEFLRSKFSKSIKGKILPEETSKPRFLAVNNDQIYIADLGRSLIYGTTIRNQFDFHCTTVFGGQGRGTGEMTDPSGLYIDTGGNVINADSKNDRIQIFSSTGEYKATMKLNERIKRPSGICTNRAGTQLYVSCYLAGCVRAFQISY